MIKHLPKHRERKVRQDIPFCGGVSRRSKEFRKVKDNVKEQIQRDW